MRNMFTFNMLIHNQLTLIKSEAGLEFVMGK